MGNKPEQQHEAGHHQDPAADAEEPACDPGYEADDGG